MFRHRIGFLGTALWWGSLTSLGFVVVPMLFSNLGNAAIAGAMAAKKYVPPSSGTLPTHTPLFVVLLISTIIVVGALTFLPALALGPIVEHLMLYQ